MVDDALQREITTYGREEHARRYLRSFSLRSPAGTDVGASSWPDTEARAHADVAMVLYNDAKVISGNTNLIGSTGGALIAKTTAYGIDEKLPAVGASGFIIIAAGETGGTIAEGTIITYKPGKLQYQVTVGDTYTTGMLCPVIGISTGPATDLPPGVALEWDQPPNGISPTAIVADNGEGIGLGLTGGRVEETDEELIERVIDLRKNPPASGNSAAYREAARKTPGVAVEAVYAYEAPFGAGTTSVAFTMRAPYPGASRVPNLVQVAAVEAQLLNSGFPGDDGLFVASMDEPPVDVQLAVKWTKAAKGWTDQAVWPPYVAGGLVKVKLGASASATVFTLKTSVGGIADPKAGQTIGFYDRANRKWSRKRIASVVITTTGAEWIITCVTTANASDLGYTPVVNQLVSPWSDSLQLLVLPLLTYFKSLGPGEMFTTFWDEGTRQKRQPESPDEAPHVISSRDLSNTPPKAIASDVSVYAPTPNGVSYDTPVGTPGVIVSLLVLGDFAVYPKG